MKLIMLLILLTGCVTTTRLVSPNPTEKVYQCVLKLIGELNIEAEKAERVCNKIFEVK